MLVEEIIVVIEKKSSCFSSTVALPHKANNYYSGDHEIPSYLKGAKGHGLKFKTVSSSEECEILVDVKSNVILLAISVLRFIAMQSFWL